MHIQVIGMDPSLRNWGFARAKLNLETFELVNVRALHLEVTAKGSNKQVRASSDTLRRARELLAAMKHQSAGASVAFAEIPSGTQSFQAAQGFGICIGVLASCEIPLIQVNPSEVKLAAVGKKTATKGEMIAWAMERHPEAPWLMRKSKGKMMPTNANEHLADALAAIYAGLLSDEFASAAAMLRSVVHIRSA